jgi:hypothetical protein
MLIPTVSENEKKAVLLSGLKSNNDLSDVAQILRICLHFLWSRIVFKRSDVCTIHWNLVRASLKINTIRIIFSKKAKPQKTEHRKFAPKNAFPSSRSSGNFVAWFEPPDNDQLPAAASAKNSVAWFEPPDNDQLPAAASAKNSVAWFEPLDNDQFLAAASAENTVAWFESPDNDQLLAAWAENSSTKADCLDAAEKCPRKSKRSRPPIKRHFQ